MVDVLIIYLGGWALVTLGAYIAGRRLNDPIEPAQHQFWVSMAAGALWPLLLVGLIELSSIMVATKTQSKPEVSIFA